MRSQGVEFYEAATLAHLFRVCIYMCSSLQVAFMGPFAAAATAIQLRANKHFANANALIGATIPF